MSSVSLPRTVIMPHLPSDIVDEILSRVPTKPLCRLRATCKRWNALFSDQDFTKNHTDRAAKEVLVFMLNKHKVFSMSVNLDGIESTDNNDPFIEVKDELSLKNSLFCSEKEDIYSVFHCDGLFLCRTVKDRLVVWNPCTGQTRHFIPSTRSYPHSISNFALGYEKNKSCRSYKLLTYRSNHSPELPVVVFEILDLSSGSWRVLEITGKFLIRSRGVSLKGDTYWLVYYDNYILSFDFSTERLGRLCLPYQEITSYDGIDLSVVREEQLSLLHNRYAYKIEIWVTTNDKIDQTVVLSWRKCFVVDVHSWSNGYRFLSCLSFCIDKEKKVLVICDGGPTTECVMGVFSVHRKINLDKCISTSGATQIFNYVPSLVQIQQGEATLGSGKRKERS